MIGRQIDIMGRRGLSIEARGEGRHTQFLVRWADDDEDWYPRNHLWKAPPEGQNGVLLANWQGNASPSDTSSESSGSSHHSDVLADEEDERGEEILGINQQAPLHHVHQWQGVGVAAVVFLVAPAGPQVEEEVLHLLRPLLTQQQCSRCSMSPSEGPIHRPSSNGPLFLMLLWTLQPMPTMPVANTANVEFLVRGSWREQHQVSQNSSA